MRKTISGGVTVTYQVWDGEGNNLISTTDEDEAFRIRRKAQSDGKYAKVHTHREWPCDCGATVHSSGRDADCEKCGACFNRFGQRLNRNWRSNRSNCDENVSDMDGYEDSLAGDS